MRPIPPYANRQARRSGAPTSIDLSALIACTRSTEASHQTGAETDGSTPFLAWASANVLRVQNRGSRNAVFVEGARTNQLTRSRDLVNAAWLAGTFATTTGDVGNGPDGAALADRSQVSSGGHSVYRSSGGEVAPFVLSAWSRATSGTSAQRIGLRTSSAVVAAGCFTEYASVGTTYQRSQCIRNANGYFAFIHDGTSHSGVGGTGAVACDLRTDLHQLEPGAFASSAIRTTTTAVTRSADACVIASASIPAWLRSGKWQTTIALECTSAEFIAAATEMTLFAFSTGTNDRISLVLDSGSMKVRVTQGGATRVTTSAITATSRYLDITLTFDSAAGSVTVAGATTGNGTTTATAWTMQSGDVYVGNVSGGTTPYFGEILPTVAEVP